MKVGFVSRFSPLDKRTWSGTAFYSLEQIKKKHEVELFNYKWTWRVREWLTMQKSINKKLFKRHTVVEFLHSYAKYFSRQLQNDLKKRPVDLLFVSASSQLIAYLDTQIPIIYMTDATFQQLQGYYPYFSDLPKYNTSQGIELDKRAFHRATHSMLASEWNRLSAINDYQVDPAKITVAPCGANLDHIPPASTIDITATGTCRLLFLAVEWERKGGEIALEVFRSLKRKGINASLHIIGCTPPRNVSTETGLTIIPFLDKNKKVELLQLYSIFQGTDFLLLPTRAECAGVVFSEASAFGIPSITTDTGGVTTYVKDNINGFALPITATASDYAGRIAAILADRTDLSRLKKSSREFYDSDLSWNRWGESFDFIAQKCLDERH